MDWSATAKTAFDPAKVEGAIAFFKALPQPIRPPQETLEAYRELVARNSPAPVLVLGATPELIDLALDLGSDRVVSMDWNADTFEAMRRTARNDWQRVDFVHQEWTSPKPEFAGQFGSVLCDGGAMFLPSEQWEDVSSHVHAYLRPGGLWIARCMDGQGETEADFESTVRADLAAFDGSAKADEIAYRRLALHLRISTFREVADRDGNLDQALFAARNDLAADLMQQAFADGSAQKAADQLLRTLLRPSSGPSMMKSAAGPDVTVPALKRVGFACTQCRLSGDNDHTGIFYLTIAERI
ncbi:MAG: class I SAM-dependent methyltransferase [Pseudomonadota bacterium]